LQFDSGICSGNMIDQKNCLSRNRDMLPDQGNDAFCNVDLLHLAQDLQLRTKLAFDFGYRSSSARRYYRRKAQSEKNPTGKQ